MPAWFAVVASGTAVRRLAVEGEIDILTAPDLARFLEGQLSEAAPGTTIAVDLSGVRLLSAVGVDVLLHAAEAAAHIGVRLLVHPASPRVQRVLDICGVHRSLEPPREL